MPDDNVKEKLANLMGVTVEQLEEMHREAEEAVDKDRSFISNPPEAREDDTSY